jgi:hypothetical protein
LPLLLRATGGVRGADSPASSEIEPGVTAESP